MGQPSALRGHQRSSDWRAGLRCGARAEAGGALQMLEDPLMHTATAEIVAGERPRHDVQRDIKAKVRWV